ncbi:uncharacterized protein LOC142242518 [Haematobia irritans]|uniref:uncharacterized protein LOC142242518 n=1 Tax=Haematobia irritans TaxID=7368 RepID=UPI003F4F49F6
MPRLRKQSYSQRQVMTRLRLRSYREQNRETDRTRNSERLSLLRQSEEYREAERERDRMSHVIRRRNVNRRRTEQERNIAEHSQRREFPEYRLREQSRNTAEHSLRRLDVNIRHMEQIQNTIQHSVRRNDPDYRAVEQARNTQEHAARRQDEDYRQNEQNRNTEQHSARRENPDYRAAEQARNTQEHAARRQDENYRQNEQNRNTEQHSARREDPDYRAAEQARNTQEHATRRQDEVYRQSEQIRNTEQHSARREDPDYRAAEQARNTQEHAARRQDEVYRQREQNRNTAQHSARREDPLYRMNEQFRNTDEHAVRRLDPIYRHTEQTRNTLEHSTRRQNFEYRLNEQERNTHQRRLTRQSARLLRQGITRMRNCRVRLHRLNPINREAENSRQTERNRELRRNISPEIRHQYLAADALRHSERMLSEFSLNVRKGPTSICVCCGGLWFPSQVKRLNKNVILATDPNLIQVFFLCDTIQSEDNNYKFCNNCHKIVTKDKRVPNNCLSNGLHFPPIPNELKELTTLEERFVAPRIPFMRIISLGYNRQCGVRGAVVNIPITLNSTVNVLPRTADQTEVVQVHLKRKLSYNHSFITETIRPTKIFDAARYLINTELYQKHNITISSDWLNNMGHSDRVPFIANIEDEELVASLINNSEADELDEVNPQETLIENNPVENLPLQHISVAPGEGQRPLDLLLDEDSEELSYPTIYCGVKRYPNTTIAKVIKSEALRYDRRCARVDKVLYSYKKLELSKIKSSISTCLRKKLGARQYTASDVLNDHFVQDLIQHDEGYHILKGLRSAPAHWEAEKKKVLAMIRQFGLPTFFITLSAAESQWPELIVVLVKILENKDITEEEALGYSTQRKYDLIRSDPITCSRYFDQRIRHLFKHFKANGGVFESYYVTNFYWRIEFQHRGSPHVHGIYWLNNAPTLNLNDETSYPHVVEFIDKFISTDSTIMSVQDVVGYQLHHHTLTCQREIRGQRFCRFRIPHPPMSSTEILLPFSEDIEPAELLRHKDNYEKINNFLNARLPDDDYVRLETVDDFLADPRINLSKEEYISALRSSIKKPQVFLKRTLKDRNVNAFNPQILAMQRANMDIQFVLDAYACVTYIVNYINKSSRGVSRLLQEAMNEIRNGNFSVKQRLQHIGNKFISASEVSAQEAAYNILGLSLSQCSNAEIFINTFPPERRVRVIKSREELQGLPQDSTDIFKSNLLDHYALRPQLLNNVCLASFAANYLYSKTLRGRVEDDNSENVVSHSGQVGAPMPLMGTRNGYIYKKSNPCIIRFPTFKGESNSENYFRSLVMLYYPWRNERTDILENDNESTCRIHKHIIEENRLEFELLKQGERDEILQQVQDGDNNYNISNDNAASAQLLDDEFRALAFPEIDENVNVLNIGENEQRETNDLQDGVRLIRLPPLVNETDLLESVRTLNPKQRAYLHHILYNVVEKVTFYEYIGGGAGVGKSRLIKTIYQSITHRFNSIPGVNPDLPKVLLTAPTGKAAFGIGGSTLHAMFSLPVNQYSGELRPLSSDNVNTLVAKFLDLKVIIIDEISMVGARMLGFLDSRLKQIFKNNNPFGGISILAFGDFKQLPPVGDRWIFYSNSANPYGAIVGGELWDRFTFYELTEIMRQREDLAFALALNRMSTGEMTDEDISIFKSRIVNSTTDIPCNAIHLFWSNEEASNYNNAKLNQIQTEAFSSKAVDIVKSDSMSIEQKIRILQNVAKLKTSETQGLCHELTLKVSAKYMMTININTADGLVNGASGILKSIDFEQGSQIPKTLWVLFSDENVGRDARRQRPHSTELLWTSIDKCQRTFQFKRNEQISIDRRQFPLVVAEGITIHKSQGATYESVAVHTRSGMSRAALYVACSRATNASGLFIIGSFNPPNGFLDSDPVKIELNKLNSSKLLNLQHDFNNSNRFKMKLFYHNIQSFRAHREDLITDHTITASDFLCLVETWTFPEEEIDITGFAVIDRIDCINPDRNELRVRNKRGITILARTSICQDTRIVLKSDYSNGGQTFQYVVFEYNDMFVIVLYRNTAYAETLFRSQLGELMENVKSRCQNILLIGDFNICRRSMDNLTEKMLCEKGFSSLLSQRSETTKHGTQIDWAFSTLETNGIISKTYTTVYSHHDGITVAI